MLQTHKCEKLFYDMVTIALSVNRLFDMSIYVVLT